MNPWCIVAFFPTYYLHSHLLENLGHIAYVIITFLVTLIGYCLLTLHIIGSSARNTCGGQNLAVLPKRRSSSHFLCS